MISSFRPLPGQHKRRGKRFLAWSQGRSGLPGNDCENLYNSRATWSVRQHTEATVVWAPIW